MCHPNKVNVDYLSRNSLSNHHYAQSFLKTMSLVSFRDVPFAVMLTVVHSAAGRYSPDVLGGS